MNKEAIKQNKMGTMPEGKLLIFMGAPLMLSMLVAAFYNIVDTYFVSQIPNLGDEAANALSLAFPVQMFMTALNVGTGVGIGAVLSTALGSGDRKKVSKTAGNAMFLYCLFYVVMLLFGLLCAKPFMKLFTDNEDVLELGTTYLRLVTCLSFGNMGEKCFEKLLQATGKNGYSMIGQMVGAILNIALDPVFIFGYLGMPAMGVAGAAVATVIGQCCAVAITSTLHFCKNKEIENHFEYLKPNGEILREVMKIGVPAILIQSLTSFMTLGMNFILKGLSAASITAYGIYYKLQHIVFMPAFGLNNASIPIIGYNCGAKNFDRVRKSIRYGLFFVTVIMIIGTILFECLADSIVRIFGLSEEVSSLCVVALRIISIGFIFAGINVLLQGVCQALGNGVYSLIISLLRLIVIVLPFAAILATLQGAEEFIWVVFPAAEAISLVIACVLSLRQYRKIIGTNTVNEGGKPKIL